MVVDLLPICEQSQGLRKRVNLKTASSLPQVFDALIIFSETTQVQKLPRTAMNMVAKKRNWILQFLIYLWVSPNSLLGSFVGLLGLATGGKSQYRRGCIEFYGGFVTWMLAKLGANGVSAMTLGHTILGRKEDDLAIARDHEHIHVGQYERWGPFFIPVYLGYSVWLWFQKRDCYMENPFEVEAYKLADPRKKRRPKS